MPLRRTLIALLVLSLPVLAQPKPPAFPPLNLNLAKQAQSAAVEAPAAGLGWDEARGILAVACEDRALRAWTRTEGKDLLAADAKPVLLKGHDRAITACAAGGGLLASASLDGKVILWNVGAGKPAQTFSAGKAVRALVASPDGQFLAGGSEDGSVHLWNPQGQPVRQLAGPTGWVLSVAFSPDGKTLAAGGTDGKLWAWEVGSGKKLFDVLGQAPPTPKVEPPLNCVSALAFSPDGKQIALGGSDGKVYLFQANDGKFVRAMQQPHSSGVAGLTFHPGGAVLVSAGKDRSIKLWNPANGQLLKNLEGHGAWIEGVAFLDRGTRLVTASADRTVRVWDLVEPPKPMKK